MLFYYIYYLWVIVDQALSVHTTMNRQVDMWMHVWVHPLANVPIYLWYHMDSNTSLHKHNIKVGKNYYLWYVTLHASFTSWSLSNSGTLSGMSISTLVMKTGQPTNFVAPSSHHIKSKRCPFFLDTYIQNKSLAFVYLVAGLYLSAPHSPSVHSGYHIDYKYLHQYSNTHQFTVSSGIPFGHFILPDYHGK